MCFLYFVIAQSCAQPSLSNEIFKALTTLFSQHYANGSIGIVMTCIFNDLICIVLHERILYKKTKKTRLIETTFPDIKSQLHNYITIKKITFSLFQYNCIVCLQYQHYSYFNFFNII